VFDHGDIAIHRRASRRATRQARSTCPTYGRLVDPHRTNELTLVLTGARTGVRCVEAPEHSARVQATANTEVARPCCRSG
jgi:hypothetical protein